MQKKKNQKTRKAELKEAAENKRQVMACKKRWDSSARSWDKKAWDSVKGRSEDSTTAKTINFVGATDVYFRFWSSIKARSRTVEKSNEIVGLRAREEKVHNQCW